MSSKLSLLAPTLLLAAVSARAAGPVLSLEEAFGAARDAAVSLHSTALTSGNDEDRLLDLLDDNDPAVRAQAALSLRPYAADGKVSDRLREIIKNSNEDAYVRKAAIKSLSDLAAQSEDVRDALIEQAKNQYNNDVVREIACKALYTTLFAGSSSDKSRDALTDILKDSNARPTARAAAAWGLFPDAEQNEHTQDALLDAAKDRYLDAGARAEALRSLYFAMDKRSAVADGAKEVADDRYAPEPARSAAVLIHHRIKDQSSSVRDWLQDLAQDRSTAAPVRTAAVRAQGDLTPELARYFHFVNVNGRYQDPLADE